MEGLGNGVVATVEAESVGKKVHQKTNEQMVRIRIKRILTL